MTVDPKDALAAERTLLAWIRTGIALMGFGFVVARFGLFLRELARLAGHAVDHGLDGAALGPALVAAGVVVNVWASLRHRRILRQLHEGGTTIGVAGPMALGVATGVAGIILIGALVSALLG
jgi:putative membrane protein